MTPNIESPYICKGELPFFVPISKNSCEKEHLGWIGRVAENVFNFGGRQVKVLSSGKSGLLVKDRKHNNQHWVIVALKILAIALIGIPLLIIKYIYRSVNKPIVVVEKSPQILPSLPILPKEAVKGQDPATQNTDNKPKETVGKDQLPNTTITPAADLNAGKGEPDVEKTVIPNNLNPAKELSTEKSLEAKSVSSEELKPQPLEQEVLKNEKSQTTPDKEKKFTTAIHYTYFNVEEEKIPVEEEKEKKVPATNELPKDTLPEGHEGELNSKPLEKEQKVDSDSDTTSESSNDESSESSNDEASDATEIPDITFTSDELKNAAEVLNNLNPPAETDPSHIEIPDDLKKAAEFLNKLNPPAETDPAAIELPDDLKVADKDLNLDKIGITPEETAFAKKAKERDYKLDTDIVKVKDRLKKTIPLDTAPTPAKLKLNKKYETASEFVTAGPYQVVITNSPGVSNPYMEDRHLVTEFEYTPLDGQKHTAQFFGIFDGHGGEKCANYIQKHIIEIIKKELESYKELNDLNIWNALKIAFVKLNDNWKNLDLDDGSTASVILILEGGIWSVNVGDSRAVLSKGGKTIQLSEDAKADVKAYHSSVKKRGGFIRAGRVSGVLAVARSFGDKSIEGLTSRPKIHKIELSELNDEEENFIINASDGLWDTVGSEESFAHEGDFIPMEISMNLIEKAIKKGSKDNISVMVINLKKKAAGS